MECMLPSVLLMKSQKRQNMGYALLEQLGRTLHDYAPSRVLKILKILKDVKIMCMGCLLPFVLLMEK
jgi:hypothetical protein